MTRGAPAVVGSADIRAVNAILRPSADHIGGPVTPPATSVSWRSWPPEWTPFPGGDRFASDESRDDNPSGESMIPPPLPIGDDFAPNEPRAEDPLGEFVSLPSIVTSRICGPPSVSEMKASRRPSGDQRG